MSEHHPRDDRQHGHAIRRRQGGRTSIYHEQLYPMAAIDKNLPHGLAINEQGPAVPCQEFDPAKGDPGSCSNCGQYDGDHSYNAMGPWASNYVAEMQAMGSDSATGAY